MLEVEPLDVLAVPFPYVDRPVARQRPAVVLAKPHSDTRYPLLWVVMITSAIARPWPGDIVIENLLAAGLPRPCLIRPAKIAVIEARAIERWGHLAPNDARALCRALEALMSSVQTAAQ